MSKISLEPNASGAGTFTLAAPNSNTNRTLTLPDEAGTILSDASTIDSNNLQSDVYKQDNILGTVSESSGVPTGAIIERGSNSNGEFVRYADGTMICGMPLVQFNGVNSFRIVASITYPSPFTEVYGQSSVISRAATDESGTINKDAFFQGTAELRNGSGGAYRFETPNSNLSTDASLIVNVMVFGRWY